MSKTDFKNWESDSKKNLLKMIVGNAFGEEPELRIEDIRESRMQDARVAIDRIGITAQDIAIDLGAGFGWVTAAMAPDVRKVICSDISKSLLLCAREQNSTVQNVEYIHHERGDLSPLYNKDVTKIIACSVFTHFNTYELVLYFKEIKKVLSSEGLLYFDYFNIDHLNIESERAFVRHLGQYQNDREALLNIAQWHSQSSVLRIAEQLGYQFQKGDNSDLLSWMVFKATN